MAKSILETTLLNAVEADRILASIVRIDTIIPIVGADRVVVAEIEGWKCVVAKDDFKVGDLAVYYCEDSMPNLEDSNLKFLKDKDITRIKIMKLRGVVSQGLLGPLCWMQGIVPDIAQLKVGDDLTQILQVKKYVKTEELEQYSGSNKLKGLSELTEHFPKYIPKTDEDRLQNNLKYLHNIVGRNIVITRKEDGCSGSFVFNKGKFSVCGRNFTWLDENQNSKHYFSIEKEYDIGKKMMALGKNLAIQGEIVGPKINGNKLGKSKLEFVVFNIYDIDMHKYLNHDNVTEICINLDLKQVPLLYKGPATDLELNINGAPTMFDALATNMELNVKIILGGLITMSNSLNYSPTSPAEGLVVKTDDANSTERISFKVISQIYALKYNK